MLNEQCTTSRPATHDHSMMCHFRRVSWTAIIVGALVGIGTSFLLNLFSIAIGLSMVTTSKEGMATVAIGGFIGLLIGSIASMFAAGYTAGYLGRPYCVKRHLGCLYGFTTWCLALVLTGLLAANLGHYMSVYANFITHPSAVAFMSNSGVPAVAVSTDTATTANNLGMSGLLIFVLFFAGAFASVLGGHCGMSCGEDHCTDK